MAGEQRPKEEADEPPTLPAAGVVTVSLASFFKPPEIPADAPPELQLCGAAERGDLERLRELLAAGADLDATPRGPDAEALTALMRAARRGQLDAARLLLEHGADVNARSAKTGADAWGKTALMYAAQAGETDLVHALLEAGAWVDARDEYFRGHIDFGFTALHYAAKRGHLEAVRALLAAGSPAAAKTHDGETAASLAEAEGHAEVAAVLTRASSDTR
jgi:ankyrin repeat protein